MKMGRVLVLVMACLGAATAAQAQSGSIQGTVSDPSGAVLPGVTVEASSSALIEQSRSTVTDGEGRYTFLELRPGSYLLSFTLSGFQVLKRDNIVLTTGFTAGVNVTLQLGALGETVTVTSESPIVDTVNTRVQTVVNQALIEALPLPKNAGAFANLIPGALGTQDVGGSASETGQAFSIHGGSSADFQQFRDGMNANSLLASGNILSSENPSMLQEVVVETGGFDPTAQTGGGHINLVTKDGGNQFGGTLRLDFSNAGMQANNLNDALRARGATVPGDIRDRHDYNGSLGGPLIQNKLWFIAGFRNWVTSDYQPGNYYNLTQGTMLYTPDPSRPAYTLNTYKTTDARVTWQVSPKNKFTTMVSSESNCSCFFALSGNISPEAAGSHHLFPEYRVMSTWTYTISPNLLLWAGGTYQYTDLERAAEGTGSFADRSILESSTNYRYGAAGGQLQTPGGSWGNQKSKQINQNVTLSYVRGKHAFQFGLQTMQGIQTKESFIVADALTYTFNNQKPSSVTEWATPYNWAQRVDYYAAFVGDQWKVHRLALNLGLRYDGEVGSVPVQHLPAGPFVPERDFPAQNNIPNFKDINPRIGIAYDLSGDGRTAIKASFSRNLAFDPPGGIVQLNNPVNLMVISTTRTWSDPAFSATDAANANFVPGCNLQNPAANTANGQTCGAINSSTFGTVVRTTNYSPDTINGWYKRQYNWTASASIQRELRSGLSANVGYFRTWYGNFTLTDNLSVTPADYSPYCITEPANSGLPNGGGSPICGLYDANANRFGQINNLIVPAANFGSRTQVFNGIDATANYRRRGFVLAGGLSTGSTVTDQCFTVDSPQQLYQCHVAQPWSANTQLKFQGVAPLPRGFQLSANFQMLPSIAQAANYAASNTIIAPSLGRSLSACPASGTCTATVTIPLITPNSVYNEGWNRQFDFRVSRAFKFGHVRALPAVDVYNLFNASPVLAVNSAYGPAWQNVTSLLGARVAKLGVQVSF
ncbi:MAG: carboxypeptidase regulatory-like domain-containing protein [Acidobacteriota bacterium]